MLNFARLNAQLDRAAHDVGKIQELYDDAQAQIEAAPADQKQELEARFLWFCQCRAELAKQLLEVHLEPLKTASN